jgi:hypothetical protein
MSAKMSWSSSQTAVVPFGERLGVTVRISRNPGQRKAWRESNLVAFCLAKGWTNLLLWEQAWKIHEVVAGNSDLGVAYAPAVEFPIPVSSSKMEQLQIR